MQEEPTDSVDTTTLGFWASVGLVKGKPFVPDERMKKILTEAAAVRDATGQTLAHARQGGLFLRQQNLEAHVCRRLPIRGATGVANWSSAALFFLAATRVTPAMDTQIVGKGSVYRWTAVIRSGRVCHQAAAFPNR